MGAARFWVLAGGGALILIALAIPRQDDGRHHDAGAALDCLGQKGAEGPEGQYVAVDVLGARLNIAFEPSTKKAEETATDYKIVTGHKPVPGTVFRRGNVVLAWDRPPTDRQQRKVDSCLEAASD